jgi:hypothetical protein
LPVEIALTILSVINWASLARLHAVGIRKLATDIAAGKYATSGELQQAMGALMR